VLLFVVFSFFVVDVLFLFVRFYVSLNTSTKTNRTSTTIAKQSTQISTNH